MEQFKKLINIFSLPIIFTWLIFTLFVDILAVPTVFRNVTNIVEAGKVGMTIFTAFNRLEFIFALIFLSFALNKYKKERTTFLLILSTVLLFWSISYNIYFTPKIIYFADMVHSLPAGDPMIGVYKNQHMFYHGIYRYLDTAKIIYLITALVMLVKNKFTEEK
jgi:hypothetical protein